MNRDCIPYKENVVGVVMWGFWLFNIFIMASTAKRLHK